MTLNYSTTVPAAKTVGEVQAMLAEHGADAVTLRYVDRQPVGVGFVLATPHGDRTFALPVNVDGVHTVLNGPDMTARLARNGKGAAMQTRERAAAVAWRVLKDWLEAQLAIIEAQMAQLDQVMLPYLVVNEEAGAPVTLYDAYRAREERALEPPA